MKKPFVQSLPVLEKLTAAGYEAYFVGGCVRDTLLGRSIKDIDIATSAMPEQVMELFERTIPTGLQHGTVTVLLDERTYEVTTFRKESEYVEYRRPEKVEFITELEEDLRRRDFTINAMAMDRNGRIRDPFGGKRDLEARLLRCVGAAEERFHEDALRMMRCVRFAANYGFAIDKDTWLALLENAPLLRHIAMERVRSEWDRLMEGQHPHHGMELLVESRLPLYTKSVLDLGPKLWDGQDRELLNRLRLLDRLELPEQRWTWLFAELDMSVDNARSCMKKLTFAGKPADHVSRLLGFQRRMGALNESTPESVYKQFIAAVFQLSTETARSWLDIARKAKNAAVEGILDSRAVGAVPPDIISLLLKEGTDWLDKLPASSVRELAVNGGELAEKLSVKPGPMLGRMLDRLLWDTALGVVSNERESLLSRADIIREELDAP